MVPNSQQVRIGTGLCKPGEGWERVSLIAGVGFLTETCGTVTWEPGIG